MKTTALLVAAVAAAAATLAPTATAEVCVLAELAPTFLDILDPVYACSDATGYNIVPPTAKPTAAQGAAICAKCTKLIAAASKKTFPACTLKLDGVDVPLNEYFGGIVRTCGDTLRSTDAGSGTGSPSTKAPTVGATVAPANMTTATGAKNASNASSNASSSAAKASDATPAPTTSGSSSNSMASRTAAAIAVASMLVACAL